MSSTAGRGVAASILASVLFGAISLLGGHLDGFTSEETTAWRVLFILAALGALHASGPRRAALIAVVVRIARSPRLIVIVLVNTAIMWVQLWVFMWGPANGHAQDIAFGYFLLPLVMVVVGRVFFRDRLQMLQWGAVAAAAVGVGAQALIAGGVNWPVLIIAGLYPVYFALRRWAGIDSIQVFLIEIALLVVPAIIVIIVPYAADPSRGIPATWPALLVMAALSAVAMICYILASRLLPLSLFGLLSYLEPVLVLGASLLLGEVLTVVDTFVYLPIVVALVLLGLSGRRRREHLEEPPL
ncbi:chloramphenicol-sensitive protein RarD [Microbacterium ginsengiterrae]|uniref:Chloramphenicol-sensitive protein RarD n=1 Tax=Microbacterium ginsengiterrae TaxID=546115 RepID=A0A7W9CBX0_9MICO|nr:EamA family transporter RarD [Microbacterium ginsengiterrae]MBB5742756.1 chloramphenicol-sensitive protein RarD [Microbacterium ginsengiterrae]